jgi:hypothetical protein
MWEARAAPGAGQALLEWVFDQALPALRAAGGLERAEVFRGAEERVVVITLWSGEPADIPAPPPGLVARAPHAWPFQRIDRPGA